MTQISFGGRQEVIGSLYEFRRRMQSLPPSRADGRFYDQVGKHLIRLSDQRQSRLMASNPSHYSPIPAWSDADAFYGPMDTRSQAELEAEVKRRQQWNAFKLQLLALRDRLLPKAIPGLFSASAQLPQEKRRQIAEEVDDLVWEIGNDPECLKGLAAFEHETGAPLKPEEKALMDRRFRIYPSLMRHY